MSPSEYLALAETALLAGEQTRSVWVAVEMIRKAREAMGSNGRSAQATSTELGRVHAPSPITARVV